MCSGRWPARCCGPMCATCPCGGTSTIVRGSRPCSVCLQSAGIATAARLEALDARHRVLETGAADWQPPKGLEEFLAAGPAVCIGFGSMHSRALRGFSIRLSEALARTGRRAVILTGWSGYACRRAGQDGDVFVIGDAPPRLAVPQGIGRRSPRRRRNYRGGPARRCAVSDTPVLLRPGLLGPAPRGVRARASADPLLSPLCRNFGAAARRRGTIARHALPPATAQREAMAEDGVGRAVQILGRRWKRSGR